MRNLYKIFIRKLEGKRLPARPRCTWEDNTRMDLKEIVGEEMDWIHLSQDRDQ
jgi:hypothetical protein